MDSCSKKTTFTFFSIFFFFEGEKEKRMVVGEGTGKGAERGRKKERSWQLPWSRGCPQGPVLLLVHVSVRPGSVSFTSFFHYSK